MDNEIAYILLRKCWCIHSFIFICLLVEEIEKEVYINTNSTQLGRFSIDSNLVSTSNKQFMIST